MDQGQTSAHPCRGPKKTDSASSRASKDTQMLHCPLLKSHRVSLLLRHAVALYSSSHLGASTRGHVGFSRCTARRRSVTLRLNSHFSRTIASQCVYTSSVSLHPPVVRALSLRLEDSLVIVCTATDKACTSLAGGCSSGLGHIAVTTAWSVH